MKNITKGRTMKNLQVCFVVIFALVLLSGCGSVLPVKVPPNSDSIILGSTTSASKKNLKVVMVQADKSILKVTEKRALGQMKSFLDSTNRFGAVTTDPDNIYAELGDVPSPQNGEFILGVTITERGYYESPLAHLGKLLLNYATLSISSTAIPFHRNHSSHVSLTMIGEKGPIDTYTAKAIARNYWTSWSFNRLKTFIAAKVIVHKQAMTSAVNQLEP